MKKKYFVLIFIILICAISVASAYTGTGFSHNIPSSKYYDLSSNDILGKYNDTECSVEESAVCTKVVDGDTIYLDNGEKVRFVGVNTPERGVEGYVASKNFVQKLCLNKKVGIDVDDSKHSDRYGRTLGVVIVGGKNVNEMLLKEGLAEVMYMPPSEFYPYNWAPDNVGAGDYQYSTSTDTSSNSDDSGNYVASANSNKFHSPDCKWGKKISNKNKIYFNSRQSAVNQGYQPCKVCCP